MKDDVIETERLILRPISTSDIERFAQIWCKKDVMKFIPGYVLTESQTANKINGYIESLNENTIGGWWVLIQKSDQKIIGSRLLRPFKGLSEEDKQNIGEILEIGCAIDKPFWGKGYSAESAMALINKAVQYYKYPKIGAITTSDNIASQNALKKIGMVFERPVNINNELYKLFVLNLNEI